MGAPRRFDHDEARRLRAAGVRVAVIAEAMGVSPFSIYRATDDKIIERERAAQRTKFIVECENCGEDCWSADHPSKRLGHDGRSLCARCRNDEKIESLRFDPATAELIAVRCGIIGCANGERWQPPENFTRGIRTYGGLIPDGIHGQCRACQTRARREYRARHRDHENAYQREYKARRRAASNTVWRNNEAGGS